MIQSKSLGQVADEPQDLGISCLDGFMLLAAAALERGLESSLACQRCQWHGPRLSLRSPRDDPKRLQGKASGEFLALFV